MQAGGSPKRTNNANSQMVSSSSDCIDQRLLSLKKVSFYFKIFKTFSLTLLFQELNQERERNAALKELNNTVKNEYKSLAQKYKSLKISYATLMSEHSLLSKSYSSLLDKYMEIISHHEIAQSNSSDNDQMKGEVLLLHINKQKMRISEKKK